MNLADLTLPVEISWARDHALVFLQDIADRVLRVQDEVADQRYRLTPTRLVDGRYMVGADLLTECAPGGFLYAVFSRLDASRFGEIQVVPMAEALALMPPVDNA